ncbi:MAG TPA: potassium/proton antiporter [Bacteroidota bacterium]|nr:potassium/proton antiporter [Bacteroidota bacterium]
MQAQSGHAMIAIEHLLVVGSILVLASIAIAKVSDKIGIPTLLLFLGIGMLAGSEGPGGIYFDDASMAQSIGVVALVIILFAGGLDTQWEAVRPVVWQAASLATLGVLITAVSIGLFAAYVLKFSLLNGLLLGAIISSTDAAAVFAVLRSKNVGLRNRLQPLLELESGSNDPMAVFLTIGFIQFVTAPQSSIGSILQLFFVQMMIGGIFGVMMGKALVFTLNHLHLKYEGIYPVLSLAFVAFVYGVTASLGGSGFLAVYLAGMIAGNSNFMHKRSQLRFFDGLAWLSQIAMFVTLGLLVFPSQILPVILSGMLVSAFVMVVARPFSVFISLFFSHLHWREKTFIAWVGLRGSVPIILATFPLIAGVPQAHPIFNIVFFIVLTSAMIQGWSIPIAARLLKVSAPPSRTPRYPIEPASVEGNDTELVDLIVPFNAQVVGRSLLEITMPSDSLIVLIGRGDGFLVPTGATILQEGDTVLVLVNRENLDRVRALFSRLR